MFRPTAALLFILTVISFNATAYDTTDELPDPDFGPSYPDTGDKEPVYDERYDPELWGVTLVKLWEMYETVPSNKVLEAEFDATKGMDYVVIVHGKVKSFLRTPYNTSIYVPLDDPLVEAKITEYIGGNEAVYNFLGNTKENDKYKVRVESLTGDREKIHIEVFLVNKWRKIRLEEEGEEEAEEVPYGEKTEGN